MTGVASQVGMTYYYNYNMSDLFYKNLPEAPNLSESLEPTWLRPFPEDWAIIKSDMVASTRHIQAGRYKEVNSASGLLIIAAANVVGTMDFPFIFGGDGATLAIPESLLPRMRPVLVGVIRQIKEIFGFDFRLAVFSVREIYRRGLSLSCGVLQISARYRQASMVGTGIDWMEAEFKNPGSPFLADVTREPFVQPDMKGFSCRWQDIPSPREETVALIVKPRNPGVLREVIDLIHRTVPSMKLAHPLRVTAQKMNFRTRQLRAEAVAMSGKTRGPRYWLWIYLIKLQMFILRIILLLGISIVVGKKNLARIPNDNVESSDTHKIENNFYTVLALKQSERESLQRNLDRLHRDGKIFYGMHISNRALLTCLIQLEVGEEVHFVDAADGGYAMASRQLKEQMAAAS